MNRSVNLPIDQSLNLYLLQISINLSAFQSIKLSICQSINLPINLAIYQYIGLSICTIYKHQYINQSFNPSIFQSINLSVHESINLSIFQSINISINQSSIINHQSIHLYTISVYYVNSGIISVSTISYLYSYGRCVP